MTMQRIREKLQLKLAAADELPTGTPLRFVMLGSPCKIQRNSHGEFTFTGLNSDFATMGELVAYIHRFQF